MKIIDWLGRLFRPPEAGVYHLDSYRAESEQKAALDAYALFTVVHLIANLLSGCEFRTYKNGEELHGEEWAALNIRPNKNQNAGIWKAELVSRLLLSGEVLCIQATDNQRMIAESFTRNERAFGDTFEQVKRSDMTFPGVYPVSEVIWLTTPVNARAIWMRGIMELYEKLIDSAADRFQKADGERGILKISAVERGKQDFAEKFDKLMNQYFKNYFASKSAVLPLFDGYDYTAQTTGTGRSGTYTNDLSAVKTLTDEAISRAAQLFGIPPSYVRGDAAGIEQAQAAMLTNCIKPLASMLSAELTGKIYSGKDILNGCRIIVDTSSILHHDLIRDAGNTNKLLGAGWTLNEIFHVYGLPESAEDIANKRFITKNYAEGGEGNEA
jgi:HK97 family phage portal protein